MLLTNDPGGGSCRAIVSDVSMVKYTSMGHSVFSEREKTKTSLNLHLNLQTIRQMFHAVRVKLWRFGLMVLTAAVCCLRVSEGSEEKSERDDL